MLTITNDWLASPASASTPVSWRVIAMQAAHAPAVAQLHQEYLRTPLRGRSGHHLLVLYYQVIAAGEGGAGLVAMDGEQVMGFVCGIWDPVGVRKRLFSDRPLALAWWAAWQMIENRPIINDWLGRWRRAHPPELTGSNSMELRPLVVHPHYRRRGVGRLLVNSLLSLALNKGCTQVYLTTDISDPAANNLYLNCGFQPVSWQAGTDCFYRINLGNYSDK